MLGLVLMVFAFVCFVIATIAGDVRGWNLTAAGLAFWAASVIFAGAQSAHLIH